MFGWKEHPKNVAWKRLYSVDKENSAIAIKRGDNSSWCTIIGDSPLPPNSVASWDIRIRKSQLVNGFPLIVGVAPSDINQDNYNNRNTCGWYFDCGEMKLYSGPPHNYDGVCYGSKSIYFIKDDDSIGIVMDTIKGDLSFYINRVNYGVAFERIPLDKPLVPCAILQHNKDSIELVPSEVKENPCYMTGNPLVVTIEDVAWNSITLAFGGTSGASFYQIEIDGNKSWDISTVEKFTKTNLLPFTEHTFRVRAIFNNSPSEWSDVVVGKTLEIPDFSTCVWKEYSGILDGGKSYSIDLNNPRVVTGMCFGNNYCTVIGNAPLPPNKVTSWNIKMLESQNSNGDGIYVGIAPSNINLNGDYDSNWCGWHFCCFDSTLFSGPPHNYNGKEYGLRRIPGAYVPVGDKIGVIMDTTKGELSFVVNGVNNGVAFEGIPLDKPLVPCVYLEKNGDSVELDTSFEVIENEMNSSIPVPSNINANSITWDTITLTWDAVKMASFYQIEVDENTIHGTNTTTFTCKGLIPETEHRFRMRTVMGKDNRVSEWCDTLIEKTQKQTFEACGWKKCTSYLYPDMRYSIDEVNTRFADTHGKICTVVGNTPIPLGQVTSWDIYLFGTEIKGGDGLYIGVAPFDIDQNYDINQEKCGWYFYCYNSTLYSGPPHNYKEKIYGLRDKKYGEYVYTKSRISVIMDTLNGDLSFALDGINLGAAYEGIPLDKPLVPCALVYSNEGPIEICPSEWNDSVDTSIPVPSNITIKNTTWESITLTWDPVEGAYLYQVKADEAKFVCTTSTNVGIMRELEAASGYNLSVRTVKDDGCVSQWSHGIREFTQKPYFEFSSWKEPPEHVKDKMKINIDDNNPRIASKQQPGDILQTVIGNVPFPLDKVTSWGLKCLKTNMLYFIFNIGVAPFDINMDIENNYEVCGWYYYCHDSTLWSGPPHKYKGKEYGDRKEKGDYVHTGDTVGVVVDTTIGTISFVVDGVNQGTAYKEIPLDKPLVPCVLLKYTGDCVELITKEEQLSKPQKDDRNKGGKNKEDCVIS